MLTFARRVPVYGCHPPRAGHPVPGAVPHVAPGRGLQAVDHEGLPREELGAAVPDQDGELQDAALPVTVQAARGTGGALLRQGDLAWKSREEI